MKDAFAAITPNFGVHSVFSDVTNLEEASITYNFLLASGSICIYPRTVLKIGQRTIFNSLLKFSNCFFISTSLKLFFSLLLGTVRL